MIPEGRRFDTRVVSEARTSRRLTHPRSVARAGTLVTSGRLRHSGWPGAGLVRQQSFFSILVRNLVFRKSLNRANGISRLGLSLTSTSSWRLNPSSTFGIQPPWTHLMSPTAISTATAVAVVQSVRWRTMSSKSIPSSVLYPRRNEVSNTTTKCSINLP